MRLWIKKRVTETLFYNSFTNQILRNNNYFSKKMIWNKHWYNNYWQMIICDARFWIVIAVELWSYISLLGLVKWANYSRNASNYSGNASTQELLKENPKVKILLSYSSEKTWYNQILITKFCNISKSSQPHGRLTRLKKV